MSSSLFEQSRHGRKPRKYDRVLWAAIEPLEPRQLLTVAVEQALDIPIINVAGATDRPFGTAHDAGYLVDLNSTYTANGTPIYDLVFLGQQGVTVMMGNGDGTFRPPSVYPVGPIKGATGLVYDDMVLADVNGDGLLDAVVVESAAVKGGPPPGDPGTVSVLLANANGTFKPEKHYYLGSTPDAVAVGELSNGYLDIAVANRKTRSVSILLGNGDGTFGAGPTISGAPPYASSIAIGDVNGDGIGDIVVAGYNPKNPTATGSITVLLGRGGATPRFAPLSLYLKYAYESHVLSIGNYTGTTDTQYDGDYDVVARGVTFINTATAGSLPNFSVTVANDDVEGIEDVNGDGILDSVTTDYGYSTVSVELNGVPYDAVRTYSTVASVYSPATGGDVDTGYGTIAVAVPTPEPTQNPALINGDLNGNGKIDIVTLNYGFSKYGKDQGPSVSVLFGFGNGTFEGQKIDNTEPFGSGNLKAKPKIPIPGVEGSVTYPAKTAKQLFQYSGSYPNDLVVADVQGDTAHSTIQEIIQTNYGAAPIPGVRAVVTNTNNAGVYTAAITTQAVAPTISNYPGTISILLNEGDGSFSVKQTITDPYNPVGVAVGDVTGDGIPDLVVINKYANFYGNSNELGNLWIFPGNGDGTFSPTPEAHNTFYAGFDPKSVALANLNGDGYSIVVASAGHYYQSNTKIYGNYTFTNPNGETIHYGAQSPYKVLNVFKQPSGGTLTPSHTYPGGVRALIAAGGGNFAAKNPIDTADFEFSSSPEEFAAPLLKGANKFAQSYGASALIAGDFTAGSGVLPNSDIAVAYKVTTYSTTAKYLYRDYKGQVILLQSNGNGTVKSISPVNDVAPGPTQLVAGDFNGPTAPEDIAVLSQTYEAISVLAGYGNGSFHAAQNIQLDNNNFEPNTPNENEYDPIAISAGDTTGDGYDDLAVAYAGTDTKPGNKVALFLNQYYVSAGASTGLGNLPTETFLDTHQTLFEELEHNGSTDFHTENTVPFGIALAAVQGDGLGSRADIVTANGNQNYYASVSTFLTALGPQFTSANNFTMTLGTYGTDTLMTTSTPSAFLTETGLLPAGVTFAGYTNGTAKIFGTPAVGTQGQYILTITADNGLQPDSTQQFTLTVDEAPVFTGTNGFALAVGYPTHLSIPTAAYPFPTMTEAPAAGNLNSNNGLPAGTTFVDLGNGTAEIIGTPTTRGTYVLAITATSTLAPGGVTEDVTLFVGTGVTPAFTSASSTTFETGDTGTFAVTASGVPVPTLTQTAGRLPLGVTLDSNTDGTLTFGGTPAAGTGGVYPLLFTASNGVPNSTVTATDAFTLTVDQPAGISANAVGTFAVNTSGTFAINTTGFPSPIVTVTSGSLPPGLSLVALPNGTASVDGVPTAPGAYPVTISATNAVGTGSMVVTFDVTEAPSFATGTANGNTGGSVTFIAGVTNSTPSQQYNITAIGFPAPVISELGFLPPGVTFSEVSSGTVTIATFTNTALAGTGGNYDMEISATNSIGTATIPVPPNNTNTSFDFVLTVDQQAGFVSAGSVTFTAGSPSSYPIIANGFPAPTITFSPTTLPSGLSFVQNNGVGTLAGTPAIGTGGTYQLVFTATNGIMSAGTQAFVLTIDQNPVFSASTPATVTFAIGKVNTYQVDTTGFPIAALTDNGAPPWLTFTDNHNGDATLSGTPPSPAATYTFTISAAGSTTVNETFTLVTVAPSAPAFQGPTSAVFPVLGNDSFNFTATGFPVSTFAITGGAPPAGVTLSAAGVLAGTPAANAGGTYALTVTATNGVNPPATELFDLYVTSAAPTLTFAPTATFTIGTSGTFLVTATGAPEPAINAIGVPAGLTFTDNGNGTADLYGTPAAGSGNIYDVTIQATNGVLPSASNILIVNVDQPPAFSSNPTDTFTAGSNGTFDVTATGFPTPAFSIAGSGAPAGVTLTDDHNGTAVLSGIATVGGTYDFTIRATNGVGSGANQSFALTVDQSASFTSASTGTLFTGAAGSIAITTNGFPSPAITETGLPAGLNLSFTDNGNGTATLSGTATSGRGGVYTVTLSAVNILDTATQIFTLDLDQAPAFTGTAAGTANVGTGASLAISTSGFPTATVSLASGSEALPSGLSITNLGSGQAEIVGTPATGTGGTYDLTLSATNGVGTSVSEGYALTVDESVSITSPAVGGGFVVEEGGSITLTSDGFPAPTFSISPALPPALSLVNNGNGTATIEGTPAPGTQGTYFFTVTATNSSSSATQSLELIVATPTITLQSGVLTITGTPDSDTCSIAVSATDVLVSIDGIQNASFPIANVQSVVINPLAGNDQFTIEAGVPMTSVSAGTGSDTIIASNSAPDTIYGGNVASSITGGSGLDFLDGGSGNATIQAGSGNTSIFSGAGNDSLTGGPGSDELKAEGPGNTTLVGGSGDSTLRAVNGNDSLIGGSGPVERLKGGAGHDTLIAGAGSTSIKSSLGHDSIVANNGQDNLIKATSGFDTVVGAIGASGMDTIVAVSGDSIEAGPRDDYYSVVIV
jgi:FG-GAP-like repeat/Putative Ig domain/RTX calcium-binding nonapeptide repeat (4 copies)